MYSIYASISSILHHANKAKISTIIIMNQQQRTAIFEKASLCHNFEEKAFEKLRDKTIKIPTYLSSGQEFIPATIATYCESQGIKPHIFAQHRGHSVYLSFGGNPQQLVDELLGKETGCCKGMGGSASIQSKEINMYGHDGLIGSQVPIAVGFAYSKREPTIVFFGDGAAEEDWIYGALGWASTKKLPILFIVEDNDLSVLTKKEIRRNWNMVDLARGLGIVSYDVPDDPNHSWCMLENYHVLNKPFLLNVRTIRKYWHAGAGSDGPIEERYEIERKEIGFEAEEIHSKTKNYVEELWRL
jgi:pyruvate dehydrogenase E1 component alpha subunit